MPGRGNRLAIAWVVALMLSADASAQRSPKRGAPQGPVAVRDVQVREVKVDPPPDSQHRHGERPTFGQRPFLPDVISRPGVDFASPIAAIPHRSFRGRHTFSLGIPVLIAYPIAYPYGYPYADPYGMASSSYRPAAPPRNTYSNVESVAPGSAVTPGSASAGAVDCGAVGLCGAVSFDISPSSAQVSIDGVFVGSVDEFTSTSDPLVLAPGDHYIEIRLPGYRTASFDVRIAAGEVTPYQGTLEPLRAR